MVKKIFTLFISLFFLVSCSNNSKTISFITPSIYNNVNYLSYLVSKEFDSNYLEFEFPLISNVGLEKNVFKTIKLVNETENINLKIDEINFVKKETSSFSYILNLLVEKEVKDNLSSFTSLYIEISSAYTYSFPIYLLYKEKEINNDITLNLIDLNIKEKNNLKYYEFSYLFRSDIKTSLYNFVDSNLSNFSWYNSEVSIYDTNSKSYKYATSLNYIDFEKDITYYLTFSFYESSKVYYFNEDIPFRFLIDNNYIDIFSNNLLHESLIEKMLLE